MFYCLVLQRAPLIAMLRLRRLTGTLGQGKPWSHGRRASTLDPKAVAAFAALEHENWEKAKRFRNGSVKDVFWDTTGFKMI